MKELPLFDIVKFGTVNGYFIGCSLAYFGKSLLENESADIHEISHGLGTDFELKELSLTFGDEGFLDRIVLNCYPNIPTSKRVDNEFYYRQKTYELVDVITKLSAISEKWIIGSIDFDYLTVICQNVMLEFYKENNFVLNRIIMSHDERRMNLDILRQDKKFWT